MTVKCPMIGYEVVAKQRLTFETEQRRQTKCVGTSSLDEETNNSLSLKEIQ